MIWRGQTDGANGERKRDSNCEKGSRRKGEWRYRQTQARQIEESKAMEGGCVQRKER